MHDLFEMMFCNSCISGLWGVWARCEERIVPLEVSAISVQLWRNPSSAMVEARGNRISTVFKGKVTHQLGCLYVCVGGGMEGWGWGSYIEEECFCHKEVKFECHFELWRVFDMTTLSYCITVTWIQEIILKTFGFSFFYKFIDKGTFWNTSFPFFFQIESLCWERQTFIHLCLHNEHVLLLPK